MLSDQENKRYNRHLVLPEIGLEGQIKLKNAKVLMIGAGGLGCPVLLYLAAAGVGEIGIVDKDKVDESNLQRQVLFNSGDIGKAKVEVAKGILSRQNPYTNITIYNEFLTTENALSIVNQYDIVIDGTDNFNSRYLINDSCVISGKPLVFGSIYKFEGQLSVFNYKSGPTYRCLYPEAPVNVPDCSEAGVVGVLPGIIGTLMANETIKIITGIGEVQSGKLFVINALDLQIQVLEFSKSPYAKVTNFENYNYLCSALPVREITASQLKEKLKTGEKIQLVDLRESYEQEKRILHAESILFGDIMQNHKKIKTDIPVIFVCKQGSRSKVVVENLQQAHKLTNLYSLKGGADTFED